MNNHKDRFKDLTARIFQNITGTYVGQSLNYCLRTLDMIQKQNPTKFLMGYEPSQSILINLIAQNKPQIEDGTLSEKQFIDFFKLLPETKCQNVDVINSFIIGFGKRFDDLTTESLLQFTSTLTLLGCN